MECNVLEVPIKEIIKEATYGRVSFEDFITISDMENVLSVKDLLMVLDKDTYVFVEKCLREYFVTHMFCLYSKYLLAIGDIDDYEENFADDAFL